MPLEGMFNSDNPNLDPLLCCPGCGHEFTHVKDVRVINTTQDGYDVADVFSVHDSLHRRVGLPGEQVDMRQGLIEIVFDGECLCPPFRVAFGQHKGQVFVRWELIRAPDAKETPPV